MSPVSVVLWVWGVIAFAGVVTWITAPLRWGKDACPYGCRVIWHDGGPYGMPETIDYSNPECPDHGWGIEQ